MRLTGGKLVKGNELVEGDLWISSVTGRIVCGQEVFYEHRLMPDETVDLKGKILCPCFIDVQLNGAYGPNFSKIPVDMRTYQKGLKQLNRLLLHTGITPYLPTIPSQTPDVYHRALKSRMT